MSDTLTETILAVRVGKIDADLRYAGILPTCKRKSVAETRLQSLATEIVAIVIRREPIRGRRLQQRIDPASRRSAHDLAERQRPTERRGWLLIPS